MYTKDIDGFFTAPLVDVNFKFDDRASIRVDRLKLAMHEN